MFLFLFIIILDSYVNSEECSVITISDSDVLRYDPLFGLDDQIFRGYNGCYYRDRVNGYIIYYRNPRDLISPGLGITKTATGVKWRLNEYRRDDINSVFMKTRSTGLVYSSASDASKNVQDVTSWSSYINVNCGCTFFTTMSPSLSPTPTLSSSDDSGLGSKNIIIYISSVLLLLLLFFLILLCHIKKTPSLGIEPRSHG